MKIIYAANNSSDSAIRLLRFLGAIDQKHIIKIAGYRKSIPYISLDWTLDALLDPTGLPKRPFDSENLSIYADQIKYFAPDLIISDMEIFTAHVASALNIPFWFIGSFLLYHAVETSHSQEHPIQSYVGRYRKLFSRDENQLILNAINNADRGLVYSHFCDTANLFPLRSKCEWIRPYHYKGSMAVPCQHNLVGVSLNNNKKLLHYLKRAGDSVFFGIQSSEQLSAPTMKDLDNTIEYACNVANCQAVVNQGEEDFLADAFYNGKPSLIFPNFTSTNSIFNGILTEKNNLGKVVYDPTRPIKLPKMGSPVHNYKVGYLHEGLL
jgi:glycosyl transferase family 1